jgi:molecular chaperone DnaK
MGGILSKLIDANTTIPTSKEETFSTASDNQSSVEIHVLQGERPMAKDNKSLGRFHLDSIMPAPRGVPQITVSLDIDSNGVLSVSAKDKASGKENKIRIEGGSQLSKEEISKMKEEAEANAEADNLEKEKVDKMNKADTLIFQTEKQLKEFDDKLSSDDKEVLSNSLNELKNAYKSEDVETIDETVEKLNTSWNDISSKLYNNEEEATKNESNDDTEDVDFEEVK